MSCYLCVGNLAKSVALWLLILFFFCQQKTAYEMRISDWSSDVCASDLVQFGNRVFSDVIPFTSAGIDAPDFQYSRNTDSEAANRCPADECYDAQHVMQHPAQEKHWRNQSAGREISRECAAAWQFASSGVQEMGRAS